MALCSPLLKVRAIISGGRVTSIESTSKRLPCTSVSATHRQLCHGGLLSKTLHRISVIIRHRRSAPGAGGRLQPTQQMRQHAPEQKLSQPEHHRLALSHFPSRRRRSSDPTISVVTRLRSMAASSVVIQILQIKVAKAWQIVAHGPSIKGQWSGVVVNALRDRPIDRTKFTLNLMTWLPPLPRRVPILCSAAVRRKRSSSSAARWSCARVQAQGTLVLNHP